MMDQAQKADLLICRRDRLTIMAGANPLGTIYNAKSQKSA
jgi:hypothetical protein